MLTLLALKNLSNCLELEPKWHWPFWYSAAPSQTLSCIHPIGGVIWALWECEIVRTSTLPPLNQLRNCTEYRSYGSLIQEVGRCCYITSMLRQDRIGEKGERDLYHGPFEEVSAHGDLPGILVGDWNSPPQDCLLGQIAPKFRDGRYRSAIRRVRERLARSPLRWVNIGPVQMDSVSCRRRGCQIEGVLGTWPLVFVIAIALTRAV